MAGKRKNSTKDSTISRKRSKATLASSKESPGKPPVAHPHGEFDASQEYKIRAIIDESRNQYLIQWEDDEATGEKYDDTWEPKVFANRLAVEDWQATKKQRSTGARSVAKKTATPRAKGRPRKRVVDSSPPLAGQSSESNGNLPRADQQEDEDLEIGESQPTAAGAEEGNGAISPLFVPVDSPKNLTNRETEPPSVHISDPPSSYAAGVYQHFSSSQIPESAVPRRRKSTSPEPESSQIVEELEAQHQRPESIGTSSPPSPQALQVTAYGKSPEASQWQPEEGDTSKTTNNTTELSLAPPSSSEPTRSVAVNFEGRPNGIIPDSQSLPDSASFVPSGTQAQTQSSWAPEAQGPGRPPQEVTQLSAPSQTQGEQQSSWQGLSSQPARTSQIATQPSQQEEQADLEPQSSQAPQEENGSQLSRSSQTSDEGRRKQPSPSQPSASDERSQGSGHHASQFPSQFDGPLIPEQSQDSPEDLASQASAPPRDPSAPVEVGSSQPGYEHLRPSASTASAPVQGSPSTNHQSQHESSQQVRSQVQSQVESQVESQAAPSKASSSTQSGQIAAHNEPPDPDVRETTERPGSSHIDLTVDTAPSRGQTSSIAITPLPARYQIAAQRNASSILPAQSWQSPSLGFQTQVFRHFSSPASGPSALPPNASSQNQLPIQDETTINRSLGPALELSTAPAGISSPIRTSSPIPSAPQQSLNTFPFTQGVPPRPTTPSSPLRPSSQSPAMDASNSSTNLARERLKAMRAQHRAKLESDRGTGRSATPTSMPIPSAPETSPPKSSIPPHVIAEAPPPNPARLASPLLRAPDGARSPSVVPAIEALPEITTEEMNTSERYPTLLPQASLAEDDEGEPQQNGSLTGKVTPSQQPSESQSPEEASAHAVQIFLVGHQRDQYPQTVYYHQDLIQKFLEIRHPDEQLVEKTKSFVDRMRSIALHPDLDNPETFTQYDVEPSQQAGWDVSSSAKFRFLKTLLDGLRDEKMHIVIALRSGRLVDILQTFLRGVNVSFGATTTDATYRFIGSGAVKVITLTQEADVAGIEKPDLIISLDNSFRHHNELIRDMRQHDGKWCPFVKLIVPNSIEHIEHHLSTSLSDQARLRALVSGIHQLREAGRLAEGQLNPTESANALVVYLKSNSTDKTWPLAGLGGLEDLDSQTESEIEPPEGTASPAIGAKRQRAGSDGREDDDLNKRVRVESSAAEAAVSMPTTINPQDVEFTRISDSIEKPTQPRGEGGSDDPEKTDVERQLQRLLHEALNRNEELTSALSDLQYRHEDARTLLIRTTSERDQAAGTAANAITRMTESANKESNLRHERSELKKELEEANLRLLTHSVPERAELESLRHRLVEANAKEATMGKRLEQARKDSDFFRSQYQDASTTAQREVATNAELRNELALITNRATGEQAKLRQMGYDARTKQLDDENKKLKMMLKDRDAGLKFRDEELAKLKEASRGRMGTRGTSVPRSPRLASPMGGRRSRQGSPAVSELKGKGSLLHPLRNNA